MFLMGSVLCMAWKRVHAVVSLPAPFLLASFRAVTVMRLVMHTALELSLGPGFCKLVTNMSSTARQTFRKETGRRKNPLHRMVHLSTCCVQEGSAFVNGMRPAELLVLKPTVKKEESCLV